MAFELDIDPDAADQIRALPRPALLALAEAFEVLAVAPDRGEPINAANPDGGVFQLPFGAGRGLITYLVLERWGRVDVLVVTWIDGS